jgi:hypothetical protein
MCLLLLLSVGCRMCWPAGLRRRTATGRWGTVQHLAAAAMKQCRQCKQADLLFVKRVCMTSREVRYSAAYGSSAGRAGKEAGSRNTLLVNQRACMISSVIGACCYHPQQQQQDLPV